MFITISSIVAALAGVSSALPHDTVHQFEARSYCYDVGQSGAMAADARACVTQLIRRGTDVITVGRDPFFICNDGTAEVYVQSANPDTTTSSYARDIGYGLRPVAEGCVNSYGRVGGENTAGGNGDFLVKLNPYY